MDELGMKKQLEDQKRLNNKLRLKDMQLNDIEDYNRKKQVNSFV